MNLSYEQKKRLFNDSKAESWAYTHMRYSLTACKLPDDLYDQIIDWAHLGIMEEDPGIKCLSQSYNPDSIFFNICKKCAYTRFCSKF